MRRRWPGIGLGQRGRGALRSARGRDFTKPVAAASTMTTPWSVAPDVPPAASRRRSAHRCPAIPAANLRICPALIWMNSCAARFSAAPSGLASAARCRPTSRCAVKTGCMRSLSCRGWSISQPRGEPPRTSKKKADRTRPARRHAFATPGRAGRASSSPKVHHQVPEGRFKRNASAALSRQHFRMSHRSSAQDQPPRGVPRSRESRSHISTSSKLTRVVRRWRRVWQLLARE